MNTEQLIGYALPAIKPPFDHTYVVSSDGHVWPCCGRAVGGRIICAGRGELAIACCLAQSDLLAGVIYGVTGMCHQIANRILYPAATTVANARGYRVSVVVFGEYGKNPENGRRYAPPVLAWPELKLCWPSLSQGGKT